MNLNKLLSLLGKRLDENQILHFGNALREFESLLHT